MTPDPETVADFVPLDAYEKPSTPTDELMRRAVRRLKTMLVGEDEDPYIASDRLGRMPRDSLDRVAAPPPCAPVIDELEATIADWLAERNAAPRSMLIVLPPGEGQDLLSRWARSQGHQLLAPPDRANIGEGFSADLGGDGPLVIPRLDAWFLRQRGGLRAIRQLMSAHADTDRRCVIGCGSWAWRYLVAATGADLLLPRPLAPKAFDADRLHRWISSLAEADGNKGITFRLSSDGKNVLARDEEGALQSDYFKQLAATSRGIPWVAWHLWRLSLREAQDAEDAEDSPDSADQGDTLWVTSPPEFTVPPAGRDDALLILQALLVHGTLTIGELRKVLPGNVRLETVVDLQSREIVGRDGDRLFCLPAAYPDMRDELNAAGFPMDGF